MATFPPAAGFYNTLDPSNPTNPDFVTGGNDWIQFIQQCIVNQWPNLNAASTPAAANPNPQEINQLVGIGTSETIETRLARLEQYSVPVGTIRLWPVQEPVPNSYNEGATNVPGPGEWYLCNGVTLDGSIFTDLWALIGNTWGGSGQSNMVIPDIRGRVVAGRGDSTRLTGYRQGLSDAQQANSGGEQSHLQAEDELRAHNHTNGGNNVGSVDASGSGAEQYREQNTGTTGGSAEFNIVQPTIILASYIRVK